METENSPPCATQDAFEHERVWELRSGLPGNVYTLFCPLCGCEVGCRRDAMAAPRRPRMQRPESPPRRPLPHPPRAHGERGREETLRASPPFVPIPCASCGRDLPPQRERTLCTFCEQFRL